MMLILGSIMTDESESSQIVVSFLESTPLDFPPPSEFVDTEHASKTRLAIQENGVYEGSGKTAIRVAALPQILSTDVVGAKRFFNNLPNKDKFKNGKDRFVRTPALKRELDDRIEKGFDAKKIEQLRESERCLAALRDNIKSRTIRGLAESANRAGQKGLKKKKIERDNIDACERTGEPLASNAQAHHKIRRSDDPDLALDLDNIEILNEAVHAAHHADERKIEFE